MRLAAEICDVPISQINLIDRNRQWTKSAYGLGGAKFEVPRNETVCHYAIQVDGVMEVENLKKDSRFSEKSFVTKDPGFRYHLGAALRSTDGFKIGALCVLHTKERKLNEKKKRQLSILADEVMARIELKKKMPSWRSSISTKLR